MQASKIKTQETYAIREKDKLVRFVVDAVVQRRVRNTGSPHDYTSTVEGYVVEDDHDRSKKLVLAPERILGPYEEHAELVAREHAEKAAKDKISEDKKRAAERLVNMLYDLTGIAKPNDESNAFRLPFRVQYGDDVMINDTAVKAMIDALQKLK